MRAKSLSRALLESYGIVLLAVSTMFASSRRVAAQQDRSENDPETVRAAPPGSSFPDAPEPSSSLQLESSITGQRRPPASPVAARFAKYIEPGQTAVKLSGFDKVLLGARHVTSSFAAATWVVSAGYEQLLNSRPNYGTDVQGLRRSVSARMRRAISPRACSRDSVLAPILHEDPRYYKLGPGHPLNERLRHALLQPIVTRTDAGGRTINFAQIGGTLAGAGLTDAYYPSINRTTGATLITFGTSMGGGAVGYLFNEFFSIHLPLAR